MDREPVGLAQVALGSVRMRALTRYEVRITVFPDCEIRITFHTWIEYES